MLFSKATCGWSHVLSLRSRRVTSKGHRELAAGCEQRGEGGTWTQSYPSKLQCHGCTQGWGPAQPLLRGKGLKGMISLETLRKD